MKLVSDEVFERATRSGRYDGTLDQFQRVGGGVGPGSCARRGTRHCSSARHVFSPSAYLRDVALGLGTRPDAASRCCRTRLPNCPRFPRATSFGTSSSWTVDVLAFAGRLGPQKALGIALEAVAAVPGVTLVIAGDGPDRAALERQASGAGARDESALPGQRVA